MNYYLCFMHSLIFMIGVWTGVTILYLHPAEWLKESSAVLIPAASVMLAAFYGAKFAYDLQNKRENKKIEEKNRASGLKAIYKLSELIDQLGSYERQVLKPFINNPSIPRDLLCMTIKPVGIEHMKIEFDPYELMFISRGENVDLVQRLSVLRSRYISVVEAISTRGNVQTESQHLLSERYGTQVPEISADMLNETIGASNYAILNDLTSSIISIVPDIIQTSSQLANEIIGLLQSLHPDIEIKKFEVQSD